MPSTTAQLLPRLLPYAIALLAIVGCDDTTDDLAPDAGPTPDHCAAVDCGASGRCVVDGDRGVCLCDPGYFGEACETTEPCAAADCGPRLCAVVDGEAVCVCPPGEVPDGEGCAPAPPSPCADVDCGERLCAVSQGEALCVCPEGTADDGAGGCLDGPPAGPCADAPCPAGQLCAAVDGQAVCVCPPGEVDDGAGGCAPPAAGPCADDPCPAGRLCAVGADGGPICACEPGLIPADGGGCVEPPAGPDGDPCDPDPCADLGRAVCRAVGDVAVCACAPGFVEGPDGCTPAPDGPCDPNPCLGENRTACQPAGDVAICNCDPGFVDVGGRCEPADPCADVVCAEPGRGRCEVVDGMPGCGCDPGLVEDEDTGECVARDLCDPNPCDLPGRSVCRPVGDVVVCECDPGSLPLEDGTCRAPEPCAPNPCMDADRSVCEVLDDGPVCRCNPGLVEDADTGDCVLEAIGDCEDSHVEGDDFEPDECPPEATPLGIDAPQAHSIEPEGDDDWYRLDSEPGHIYRFAVTRETLADGYVYLYDTDGATVLQAHDSPETITYELPDAGPYYYRVRAWSSRQTGTYSVSLTDLGLDDHGDGPDDATPIVADGPPVEGVIETRGDDDWFAFEAEAGRIYRFALDRQTLGDAYVYLYRPDGETIAEANDSPERIVYEVDEGGTWYLRVRHYSNVGTGSYAITLTEEGVDDHADAIEGATAIGVDGIGIAGDIETRADRDHFAFEARANHVYRVRLERGTLSDGYLNVYDPAGETRVSSDPDTAWFEADVDGIWTVRVRHYSAVGTGDYTVSVEDLGPDDHADTADGATPIEVDGAPAAGDIETGGDRDWFAVALPAGRIVRIAMTRAGISDGVITLYAPDGETVLANADSEVILREIDGAGLYYVRVRHYNGAGRGGYAVQVTDEGADDHADGPEGATVIAADGEPNPGVIETDADNDYFAFDTEPGHIYRLAMTSAGISDGYVYLYAPDGETSLYASDTETVTYEFADGGRYFFRVRHYSNVGRGAYTVAITDLGLDDHADGPDGATPLAADGVPVAGILETRGDADYFALQLDGGRVYRLTAAGVDVRITVFDQDAVTRLGSTGGSQLDVDVGEAGLYFVEIRADNGASIGDYTLTVVD